MFPAGALTHAGHHLGSFWDWGVYLSEQDSSCVLSNSLDCKSWEWSSRTGLGQLWSRLEKFQRLKCGCYKTHEDLHHYCKGLVSSPCCISTLAQWLDGSSHQEVESSSILCNRTSLKIALVNEMVAKCEANGNLKCFGTALGIEPQCGQAWVAC